MLDFENTYLFWVSSKNKKEKTQMKSNRINQINTFIRDYEEKTPYLQHLCEPLLEHYKAELIKEYIKLGKHPYPHEYLGKM